MNQSEAFRGTPWNGTPSADWNLPSYWEPYYCELFSQANSRRRDRVIHRQIALLIRMLANLGELPKPKVSRSFLDAGCGFALIPQVLSYWGFQVTAIDFCTKAIEAAKHLPHNEAELAQCVPSRDFFREESGQSPQEDDFAWPLQKLQSYRSPGGSVAYLVGDWCSQDLQPGSFDLIHCRNSLRCSLKPYWRQSLRRFHELLVPGGVLLLENVNAIGIQDEVEELFVECGFLMVSCDGKRATFGKNVLCMWQTG